MSFLGSRTVSVHVLLLLAFIFFPLFSFFLPTVVEGSNHSGGANISNDGGANISNDGGANISGQPSYEIKNPLKVKSIKEFLVAIVEIILVFATPIIVIYIMYAGFLFVTANGEPGQLEKARNALLFAIIGGVIILGVFVILEIIQGTVDSITNKSTS